MASDTYDIVVIADVRFPGSTGTAIAAEIAAHAAHGYRTGLLPVRGPVPRFPHRVHPDIRVLLHDRAFAIVGPERPVDCGLVMVHAPEAFLVPSPHPLRIHSRHRWCIVRDRRCGLADATEENWIAVDRHLHQALGGPVEWYVGSLSLAGQLQRSEIGARLQPDLWAPTVEATRWQRDVRRAARAAIVIGTSGGRNHRLWPENREDVIKFLPADPAYHVRVAAPFCLFERIAAPFPPTWQVVEFNPEQRSAFLSDLDIFVRLSHPDFVDDCLAPILEAMASGCAVVLPGHWRTRLDGGPLFVSSDAAAETIRMLAADHGRCALVASACVQLVRDRFGPERHVERLQARLGRPAGRAIGGVLRLRKRHVLFVASNGIGVGHVTRCLAIASRCPQTVTPVFATFSQAVALIQASGFPVHYIPSHQYLGVDPRSWNVHLEAEIRELMGLYDPAVVVFDGNHPYSGLVQAIAAAGTRWAVWCRRAMWRPGRGQKALARERWFDLILEPGELAEEADRGLTSEHRSRTQRVPPIRLVDEAALLAREQARDALGLPHDQPCILVTLGAGNNFDFEETRTLCFQVLKAEGGMRVAYALSPIANGSLDSPPGVGRVSVYPLARYLAAFDAAISAAGYNSFHELLAARIPTLFIPNQNMEMDDQAARANFAARCGMALCAPPDDPYSLTRCLRELVDPSVRSSLRRRMEECRAENGAELAAGIVAELASILRTGSLRRPGFQ